MTQRPHQTDDTPEAIRGRGSVINPPNRFEKSVYEPDPDGEPSGIDARTVYIDDPTRQIITSNDSPDVGFDKSINPYRGCEHGCVYCFARPTHEYLGYSAGLDFETRILVKRDAPTLLREELRSPRWVPQVIAMSGVTDPYQPIEKKLGITRGCLEVLEECGNPVGIITKNHLVTRDIDILEKMAAKNTARVFLSITTLDDDLCAKMEPRTSRPHLRLEAVRAMREAGIPVGIMVAPVVPGITDHEMPAILQAAADAGAEWAGYVMLRLPWAVAPMMEAWLETHFPDRKEKVLGRVKGMRGGKMYDPRWSVRQKGEGVFAGQVKLLFETSVRRTGLNQRQIELTTEHFRRPDGAQKSLF